MDVDEVKHESLLRCKEEQPSSSLRKNIIEARQIQKQRFKNSSKTNSELTNREIKSLLTISEHAENLLNKATERLKISARSYMRTIKVAQTIADLDGSDSITELHIGEALQYRKPHTDVL